MKKLLFCLLFLPAAGWSAYQPITGSTVTAILDCQRQNVVKSSAVITNTTTETVLLSSGAANVFNDMSLLILTNTSGTGTRVDIRSGGGPSGGATDFSIFVPAGDTRGVPLSHQWPQTTAAVNWTIQTIPAVTDLRAFGTFCKEP